MKKIILLVMCLSSSNAFSISPLLFGFGSTTRNYASTQNDLVGGTKTFEFNPTLLIGTTIPFFFAGVSLSPAIGYAKYSAEDNTSRNEIILQYHLSQSLTSYFLFHYGFSNTITKIGGKGGTVQLNNGNNTATFYVPSESKTSFMASLDLGGEVVFTDYLGARFQVSIDRFLSSDRRRISHMLTLNYYYSSGFSSGFSSEY